jgi:transcriptional regulator with XRE-family HTH domain
MANELGKTIRILRQAKSMKISDVAKESGVSIPYVSLVESGARQPSLEVIRRIAETLRVPPETLVVIGMGNNSSLSSDARTAELTKAVGRLIDIENKLTRLLAKEAQ